MKNYNERDGISVSKAITVRPCTHVTIRFDFLLGRSTFAVGDRLFDECSPTAFDQDFVVLSPDFDESLCLDVRHIFDLMASISVIVRYLSGSQVEFVEMKVKFHSKFELFTCWCFLRVLSPLRPLYDLCYDCHYSIFSFLLFLLLAGYVINTFPSIFCVSLTILTSLTNLTFINLTFLLSRI